MKQKIIEIAGKQIIFQEIKKEEESQIRDLYERNESFYRDLGGNVKFIGYYPGLKEEEAVKIVEKIVVNRFKNYLIETQYWEYLFETALESFGSLLRREGIYTKNPYDHSYIPDFETYFDLTEKWDGAQKNLWQKIIILKEV